ncbi:MAG: ABC transporter ATP-binding protein [Hyphomicrobiaceae bacterium]|nr:ABC transporter ATP-binding protein [Hyphomicrobiaceae bacterium]
MAAEPRLVLHDVRAGYGALDILNGVDLDVGPGEFVALMGPNGAGKSTLIKTIFGMTTFKSGQIHWKGEQIGGLKPKAILSRGIGIVPQGRCNFPLMTIEENLDMAGYIVRDRGIKAEKDYVYSLFPILRNRRHQLAGNLSGGEQQLLETAMAVLRRPDVILIDEPSVGLSPAAIGIVFKELNRLHAGGCTIILVEQNTRKAMEVAERAVVLRLGKVIWDGRANEITHRELGDLFMSGQIANRSAAPTSTERSHT